ncbi:MAG: 1,3-beta-galactosyl-N-acetylhexosamine phosphorylase, partial [bacterium]
MKTRNKISLKKTSGAITLPAEAGEEKMVVQLAHEWGADAIRDSDGTNLSPDMLDMGLKVYSTVCPVRADQAWPRQHMDQLPQKFLMSDPVTASASTITIDPMAGFYREKYVIDTIHEARRWWEVIDRTTGKVLRPVKWSFNGRTGKVTIRGAIPFHVYTVNFLVFQIWDTTSMYNHLTNNWTKPHVISVDPYHKETWDHLMVFFDRWLKDHPRTDVVRLTTLAYHFAVDSDQDAVDKFRDWVGYQDTISVKGLLDFQKQYGYRLRSEDFVDQGYYNATCRVPSKAYLDWMQFIHRFVVKFGRALADKAHKAGKRTALFQGDHWVGVEPYSPHFQNMGIDIHVGAAEDGVALRRVSDAPGPQIKELRLYPYFFPDVFREGGDPLGESMSNWVKIRRALMRKPVDRIGYGGYLNLALKFPAFVKHVSELCREFRTFLDMSGGTESHKAPVKVAVLNCWGPLRSWLNSFGAPQKFLIKRPDVVMVAGTNLLECLSGLPVEVVFISFDEISKHGIPKDVDVIINDGDAETAW